MNRKNGIFLSTILFGLTALGSMPAYAQQPLIQITAPANNSLATEGQTITITVSADPSVQIVGVIPQGPLPEVQATSSANQFTLAVPTTIPAGLYNLTAIGTNASGDVESVPVAIDVERQYVPTSIAANPPPAQSQVGRRPIPNLCHRNLRRRHHARHYGFDTNGFQLEQYPSPVVVIIGGLSTTVPGGNFTVN